MIDEPKLVHDTRCIISVNAAACDLFRCDPIALLDMDMLELLPDDIDRRWLAKLRLSEMRNNREPPPYVHTFRRHDGTLFYGAVMTEVLGAGQFETTVVYLTDKQ